MNLPPEDIAQQQQPEPLLKVVRTPLIGFPDVIIHATETAVKKHSRYKEAKSGDSEAAIELVLATISDEQVENLRILLDGRKPLLASAHAYEAEGVNAIPEAFADELAQRLDLVVDSGIVQTNVVAHTGANGFGRLARQPFFEGAVTHGQDYVLVDDFVGMGGTLANLRGYIEAQGGKVIGAVTLTGKPYSAKLALDEAQLQELRKIHGTELETWWQENYGHSFDCLTQSEARYLARSPDVDTIRDRIAEAKQTGDGGSV
ncbi:MAG: phosphoribosyltransferase [Steroidobacteraceae bacterium]|nr:phosphoribosyltransferase [Deltaproteobacteria bacterium]